MKLHTIILMIYDMTQTVRAIPQLLIYKMSPQKAVVDKDICRWLELMQHTEVMKLAKWQRLASLVRHYPAFRNVFYYRVRPASKSDLTGFFLWGLARLTWKPMDTLYIQSPSIGPGLFISWGFSTVIGAQSIGENCYIFQQVTIGNTNDSDSPTIGNNVQISSGAKVLGNIKIGDNCRVGANAVVLKDVPPNCTVVGVPAYITRRDGKRVSESLG